MLASILFSPVSSYAHEYWLDPVSNHWQVGQSFIADIRNGENFIGTAYPFDPDALRFGGLVSDTNRRPLKGRLGDYPAIGFKLEEPGLHLSLLETTAREITYDNAVAFQEFLDYHDLQETVASLSEGARQDGEIRERYFRFVKALFFVSSVDTADTLLSSIAKGASPSLEPQGQRFELVANALAVNNSELEVGVLLNGEALAGRQIEIFHNAGGGISPTRTVAMSDANGMARFQISEPGDYLINSVWIRKPDINDVDWETFWASLTFSR